MEKLTLEKIREGFDELFLGNQGVVLEKKKELYEALGIRGFAEIYMNSKKHGHAASQKVLQDLTKLSFLVYKNFDTLPLQRKIILPEENGSYKFVVTSPGTFRGEENEKMTEDIATNTIIFAATKDEKHVDIVEKLGLEGAEKELNTFGGAWIDVDHKKKSLRVSEGSGGYGSLSNQMVQWMLQEYVEQGYTVSVDMNQQKEFFTDDR